MQHKIHDFQLSILRELLFKPYARFRDLKTVDITNDHFTFHLNHLVKEGLIAKTPQGYTLTTIGKEFANRIDTDSLKIERQAKVGVAIHAVREVNGETEYLIHKRLKQPFYGWYGSHSGKIRWGETPDQTAQREFLEETGLSGTFTLKGVVHYHHFHQDGTLLEDKYFFAFRVDNVVGELKAKVEEGENIWMNEVQYRATPNTFGTFEEMHQVMHTKELIYVDRIKFVESY